MGISMAVDGSPASCRASARAVRALGREMEQSATGLARARSAGLGAWRGEAADSFGTRAKRVVDAVDAVAAGVAAFATALDAQADAIEEVKSEMRRARSIATRAGLPLAGDIFPAFGEVELTPGQEGPRDHGEAVVTRARSAEDAAHTVFSAAVEEALGLAWSSESPEWGKLAGPTDLLPDVKRLIPGAPGLPMPMPDLPDPTDLIPLTGLLAPMIKAGADAVKAAPEKIMKTGLGPPASAVEQLTKDLVNHPDMGVPELLNRASFVGVTALVAGGAGLVLCGPACAGIGVSGGSWLAEQSLEHRDDD